MCSGHGAPSKGSGRVPTPSIEVSTGVRFEKRGLGRSPHVSTPWSSFLPHPRVSLRFPQGDNLLPSSVDTGQVSANYDKGVLEITLAKKAEAKPKQIKVNVVSDKLSKLGFTARRRESTA